MWKNLFIRFLLVLTKKLLVISGIFLIFRLFQSKPATGWILIGWVYKGIHGPKPTDPEPHQESRTITKCMFWKFVKILGQIGRGPRISDNNSSFLVKNFLNSANSQSRNNTDSDPACETAQNWPVNKNHKNSKIFGDILHYELLQFEFPKRIYLYHVAFHYDHFSFK